MGAVLLNGWLVKNGMFRPLPRLAANAITLLLFVLATLQVRSEGLSRAVLIAGQFLVFLQLVKLYEQRRIAITRSFLCSVSCSSSRRRSVLQALHSALCSSAICFSPSIAACSSI